MTRSNLFAECDVKASRLELQFLAQIRAAALPEPEREYRFCERRWRFDFAWPHELVAVELEGAVWAMGRHTRGRGFIEDCHKYNRAAMDGWCVLRFTGGMLNKDEVIPVMREALGPWSPEN